MPQTPATPSEIQNELDNLNGTIQEADKLAERLHSRLERVLRPMQPGTQGNQTSAPETVLTPLATDIRDQSRQVVRIIQILQNALDRVEI